MSFQEDPTIQPRNLPPSPIGESSSSSKEEVKELVSQPSSQLLQPAAHLIIESLDDVDANQPLSPAGGGTLPHVQHRQLPDSEPLSDSILSRCKTVFIRDFSEVLTSSADDDIERRIASVPGLMIALFSHIKEAREQKKKQNKVRFSFVEEITIANME